jgi:hypothetical protein
VAKYVALLYPDLPRPKTAQLLFLARNIIAPLAFLF